MCHSNAAALRASTKTAAKSIVVVAKQPIRADITIGFYVQNPNASMNQLHLLLITRDGSSNKSGPEKNFHAFYKHVFLPCTVATSILFFFSLKL